MNSILEFIGSYSGVVALGAGFLGLIAGIMGTFIVIRQESLVGDAVSHSALPGIVIAFLIMGVKNSFGLMIGATLAGLLALFLIVTITKYSKIKFDTALALVLSTFFGFGMVLLGYIQKMPDGNHAGLDSYIFGQAAGFMRKDLITLFGTFVVILAAILLFYKEFKLYSFDAAYLKALGYNVKFISLLMNTLVVLTVVVGLQMVGVILMSAMLIAPATAGRLLSDRLPVVLSLSGIIGFIGGYFGTVISVIYGYPTGPAISVLLVILVLITLFFAPGRGLIAKKISDKKKSESFEKMKEEENA